MSVARNSAWARRERRLGAAADLSVPPFRARWPWIGGDLQTLRLFLRPPSVDLGPWPARRLWLAMPDGDALPVELHAEAALGARPLILLIHGLTGCADSHYLRASARMWLDAGYPVARLNLRGSLPARPRCAGHYHAGRSADLADALAVLLRQVPAAVGAGIVPMGYSLGGNMLIKFLAEAGARFPVRAAGTVSAPLDLAATSARFLARRNTMYHAWLLRAMKREALRPPAQVSPAERAAILNARSVRDFDDGFVAPRHGFADAADYYARCSARRFLPEVPVPLLALHAQDDPWIPARAYDEAVWDTGRGQGAVLTVGGGHVGFHGAGRATAWHDRALYDFITCVLYRETRPAGDMRACKT